MLEICRESEIGDNETLKVALRPVSHGRRAGQGQEGRTLDQDFVPEDTIYSVLELLQPDVRLHLPATWCARSGPSRRTCSRSTWARLRESRKDVFGGVKLQKDGTLDSAVIERNLNTLPEEQRRGLLVDALNELLYAELLAVKRTLGRGARGRASSRPSER